jgi:hypothetical protein
MPPPARGRRIAFQVTSCPASRSHSPPATSEADPALSAVTRGCPLAGWPAGARDPHAKRRKSRVALEAGVSPRAGEMPAPDEARAHQPDWRSRSQSPTEAGVTGTAARTAPRRPLRAPEAPRGRRPQPGESNSARPGDGYRPSGGVGERERPGSAVDHGRSDPLTGARRTAGVNRPADRGVVNPLKVRSLLCLLALACRSRGANRP